MKEDALNMSVRRFLKQLGITGQREIEAAVRQAVRQGRLNGDERLRAKASITLEGTDLNVTVEDDITLESDHSGPSHAEDQMTGKGTGIEESNKAPADPDNNFGRGAPADREERVDQLRKERANLQQRERSPDDLDREDADIQREGIADKAPGIRPQGDADFVREKG